jgi:aminomethyltransferase
MANKIVKLHNKHIALGGKMIPFAGFEMPVRYTSDILEHMKVRESVGIFDVSHMGEFIIEGPRAFDLIQNATANDVASLYDGRVQYSYLPNDQGGIVDDLLVYRFNEEKYFLVVNASNIEKDWNRLKALNHEFGAKMTNVSDDYSLFAVQGPNAHLTLQKLTSVNLSEIKYYHFLQSNFAGFEEVIISATGYTGSGGFEIYIKNEDAPVVWDEIIKAGEEFDIAPIGLGARDTLRLEMGFCLYGNDIDDNRNPYEAGLGWVTKPQSKFVNYENIVSYKERGLKQKLVAFKLIDRGIPRHDYRILKNNQAIGLVTSGSQSPILKTGIGLGYVNFGFHNIGDIVDIEIRNKMLKAEIVKLPFI